MNDLELYFQYRCEKGLKQRDLADKPEYIERLHYEIDVIRQMGFVGYFLIVANILNWARNNDIPVGPGRGSAAGALTAYVLGITHLDPIKYNLLFERFLNPGRTTSAPDIDLDFCEERRSEVVKYVQEKYGYDKVAHIGTFGTMKARAAVRAVASVLGYEYSVGDKLAKLILDPIAGKPQSLSECYDKVPELNRFRHGEDCPEKTVLIWADKLEDRIRSIGVHPSGVVISADPISRTIPLYLNKESEPTTQFEMKTVEEVGLIKFDFLGLRVLTTIQRCVDMVSKRYGIDIDPLQIPIDDKETYKTLQLGDVEGIFQMEASAGINDLLVKIRPTCLEDLGTLVALYRPGPLASKELENYLKVRAGEASPHYLTPELEPILKPTDGLMLFQEEVMEICKQLAGYSLADADLMRRAIGKKLIKEMRAQKDKFINGAVANKISENIAKELFNDIESFADYSFNKSHAISYGYISYQTAYFKTHYPLEFVCSCLISDSNEQDKVIKYISYCKAQGIEILGPSVNESGMNFNISGESIRFGLNAIKNLGNPVEEIIEERNKNGPFKSILDFADRVNLSKVNKRKLESLVLSGAFDDLENNNRASLLGAIEEIQRYKEETKRYETKLATYNKRILFYKERATERAAWDAMSKEEQKLARSQGKKKLGELKIPERPVEPSIPVVPDVPELSTSELLAHEKELTGYFISGHPLDNIPEKSKITIEDIKIHCRTKQKVIFIAIPSMIKEATTKKNKQKMSYLVLEDKTGTIQGIVLPKPYALYKGLIDVKTPAYYEAFAEVTEGDVGKITKLIISGVYSLPSIKKQRDKIIDINASLDAAPKIAAILSSNKGNEFKVNLSIESNKGNLWQIGMFPCGGNRENLQKKIKEIL